MADPEHLAQIKRGVESWNHWRKQHPALLPDLSQLNLSGARLRQANLRGVNLYRANRSSADLECADLSFANLYEANLTNANLNLASLNNSNVKRATFGWAKVKGMELSEASPVGPGSRHINGEEGLRGATALIAVVLAGVILWLLAWRPG